MRVDLSFEEVGVILARAAVEKANARGWSYRWGNHVRVVGDVVGVRAELVDGEKCQVELYVLEEPEVEEAPL